MVGQKKEKEDESVNWMTGPPNFLSLSLKITTNSQLENGTPIIQLELAVALDWLHEN